MQIEPVLASLRNIKAQIAITHGVTDLAVFGSVARGEARPDSDIDLLVSFSPDVHHGLSFYALESFISNTLNKKVDLVTLAEIHPSMRDVVLSDARYV